MNRRSDVGVEQRAPQATDLDPRLLVPAGRLALADIALAHDVPMGANRCPGCGWVIGGGQRVCPSRALARCVKDRKPVPAWLVHLIGVVPGAIAPRVTTSATERHAGEDALPGLFDAPTRTDPTHSTTTSRATRKEARR